MKRVWIDRPIVSIFLWCVAYSFRSTRVASCIYSCCFDFHVIRRPVRRVDLWTLTFVFSSYGRAQNVWRIFDSAGIKKFCFMFSPRTVDKAREVKLSGSVVSRVEPVFRPSNTRLLAVAVPTSIVGVSFLDTWFVLFPALVHFCDYFIGYSSKMRPIPKHMSNVQSTVWWINFPSPPLSL